MLFAMKSPFRFLWSLFKHIIFILAMMKMHVTIKLYVFLMKFELPGFISLLNYDQIIISI